MNFYFVDGLVTFCNEVGKFKEVAGRITANREFRKDDQICSILFSFLYTFDDPFRIVLKIANVIILLRQYYFHNANLR